MRTPHEGQFQNFIGGEWVGAAEDAVAVVNPSNLEDVVGYRPVSSVDDVNRAVMAAAHAQPSWSATSIVERAGVLRRVYELVKKNREELATLESREMGKVIGDARAEVDGALGFLEYYIGESMRPFGVIVPSTREGVTLATTRRPIGVAAVITPWNFPVSIPVKKIAAALLAGCACVFKPSEVSPGTGSWLTAAFAEAGLPAGVLNLVHGEGATVGEALVAHPLIAAVSFTGSSSAGARIAELASAHLSKVQAEMGGKNAIVVLEDADLERAAEMTVLGAFRQCGQVCAATSRAIVQSGVYGKFLDLVVSRASELRYGNPLDEGMFSGSLSSEAQFTKVSTFIRRGISEGATLSLEMDVAKENSSKGYFLGPTVFSNVSPTMAIAQEEIFGPVLSVIECGSLDEAIEIHNGTRYGLCGAIHTRDLASAGAFLNNAEVGYAGVNVATTGLELQLPVGGIKSSGYGPKEQGWAAVDFFSEHRGLGWSA